MPKRQRQLIALRHTKVKTMSGLCYGQIDVPLADSYAAELQEVRQSLPKPPYARILSSPLQRCHQLARDLQLGPVEADARLLELSFGQWEGQLWADIPRHISELWTADVVHRAPPGGESFLAMLGRVRALLEEPDLWSAGDQILLVTHAGVIRALQHLLSGDDYANVLNQTIHFGESRIWRF